MHRSVPKHARVCWSTPKHTKGMGASQSPKPFGGVKALELSNRIGGLQSSQSFQSCRSNSQRMITNTHSITSVEQISSSLNDTLPTIAVLVVCCYPFILFLCLELLACFAVCCLVSFCLPCCPVSFCLPCCPVLLILLCDLVCLVLSHYLHPLPPRMPNLFPLAPMSLPLQHPISRSTCLFQKRGRAIERNYHSHH